MFLWPNRRSLANRRRFLVPCSGAWPSSRFESSGWCIFRQLKGNWVNLFLILIEKKMCCFARLALLMEKKRHLSLVQNSTNWQFPKTSQSLDKLNHSHCQVTQVVLHFLSCHEPRLGSCQCAAVLLNWKSANWTQLRAFCIVLGNGGSQRHTYYVINIYIYGYVWKWGIPPIIAI